MQTGSVREQTEGTDRNHHRRRDPKHRKAASGPIKIDSISAFLPFLSFSYCIFSCLVPSLGIFFLTTTDTKIPAVGFPEFSNRFPDSFRISEEIMNTANKNNSKTANSKIISKNRQTIPVFFAVDDRYAPYLAVTIRSLIDNASPDYDYALRILVDRLSDEHRDALSAMRTTNVSIEFVNVAQKMDQLGGMLHLRDYYTKATYYRFFIPDLFPNYKKGIYLDSDLLLLGDISELYRVPLGRRLLGVIPDEVMATEPVFGQYSERVLGVPYDEYFNAGVLLMNLEELRKERIESEFVHLLGLVTYRVAQDQDYLNVITYGRNRLLPTRWNRTAYPDSPLESNGILHFKLFYKPWHTDNALGASLFWKYADRTSYAELLHTERATYSDAERKADIRGYRDLMNLAASEIEKAEKDGAEALVPYRLGEV